MARKKQKIDPRRRRFGPGMRGKQRRYLKLDHVDYRDIETLRKFISERGKIRSRRITGASRRQQSQIARAVKRARELGLLPYVGGESSSR